MILLLEQDQCRLFFNKYNKRKKKNNLLKFHGKRNKLIAMRYIEFEHI